MGKFIDEVQSVPPGAYIQSADPAVANPTWLQPKILWIDTTATPHTLKKRNDANDGWDTLGLIVDGEYVEDKIGTKVVAGTGINVAYDDMTGETTITNTSPDSGSPPSTEDVQDIVGAMLTDSATIDFSYDDDAGIATAIVKDASVDAAKLAPASVNAQTGTTYTLLASDNGKVVTCGNAGAITVTVPSGLGAGFNCLVIQLGAGQVTFSPSSTTINNRQSHTKIAGQYGVVSLVAYAANTFALGGDTAS